MQNIGSGTARSLVLTVFFGVAIVAAEDLKTVTGHEYKNVNVSRIESDSIVFTTDTGVVRIPISELPKEIQEKYGQAGQPTQVAEPVASESERRNLGNPPATSAPSITQAEAEELLGEPLNPGELKHTEDQQGYTWSCKFRTAKSVQDLIVRPIPTARDYAQPRQSAIVEGTEPSKILKIELRVEKSAAGAAAYFKRNIVDAKMTSVDGSGKKHGLEQVGGLGDTALFLIERAGSRSKSRLHVLKGTGVLTVGIAGVPEEHALEKGKVIAMKILPQM